MTDQDAAYRQLFSEQPHEESRLAGMQNLTALVLRIEKCGRQKNYGR